MISGKFLPRSSNQSLGPQDVTATNRQWKKWMTQKHSRVRESPTSVHDFEGVHKNMEGPMGLKDKSLNLQWKLKGPQTLATSFWIEYTLPFS